MKTDSNIGRVLEGKYEIVRVLGQGGMGVVYEARHRLINRRLAVKLLHAEYADETHTAERFRREAQAASAIGHEHIVDVTDMGFTDKGELFIVMEFLEGKDLSAFLQDGERFAPERASHIMIQVLSALEAAHAKGIIHRDLKPANIFIIQNREGYDYVKLVDFGISKMQQDDDDMRRCLTRTGEILGTPSFMSPEQARGETDIGPASDIFSCGLILYRLLTGQTAFDDKVLTMLLLKIIDETPPSPIALIPDIPPQLSDIVMQAIAKNPADRFADAAMFRRVLMPYSPDTPSQTGLSVTRFTDTSPRLFRDSSERVTSNDTPVHLTETYAQKRSSKGVWLTVSFIIALLLSGVSLLVYKSQTSSNRSGLGLNPPDTASVPVSPQVLNTKVSTKETASMPLPSVGLPLPSNRISVDINVFPADAEVVVDGEVRGNGAVSFQSNKDGRPHTVVISAVGYTDFKQDVVFDRDVRMTVRLSASDKLKSRKQGQGDAKPQKADTASQAEGKAAGETALPQPVPETKPLAPNENDEAATTTSGGRPIRKIDEVNPW